MLQCDPLSTSDLVLIILTVVALFGWVVRRKLEAPKLTVFYNHKEPMARLSARSEILPADWPVYDFHFRVKNSGMSSARNVVADIVEFRREDEFGALIKL